MIYRDLSMTKSNDKQWSGWNIQVQAIESIDQSKSDRRNHTVRSYQ